MWKYWDWPPPKSVVLDVASECNVRGSFSCGLIGLSLMGQSFLSTSKFSGTDYCISELESIVRKKLEEPVGAHVCVGSAVRFCSPSRNDAQPGLGTGQTKYCPSDSVRALLKVYFSGNPTTDNDPHQQTIGFSAGQDDPICKSNRIGGVPSSLWNIRGLVDGKQFKVGRAGESESLSMQCRFLSRARSTIAESVASRSFCSLPTTTESVASNLMPDPRHQQPCANRQDEVMW